MNRFRGRERGRRGQTMLVSVVFVGVVSMIVISAIVFKTVTQQRSTVRAGKSTRAYELAQAAVQKGIWALNLNTDNWASVGAGEPLPGYNGDVVYTDLPEGSYKVVVSSGPGEDDRTVTGYAKDNSPTPQYRALRVVLTKASSQFGCVMATKILLKKRTKVHWGPLYGYEEINIKRKSRVLYPRLFSKGKIKHIDNKPSLPNTDGRRWWSFNASPGVPPWPNVDLEYYKQLAQAQGNYWSKGDRKKRKVTIGGRAHYGHRDDDKLDDKDKSDDDEYSYNLIIDTQPYVRYFDEGIKVKFKGGHNLLRGAIIAMDTIEFKDHAASVSEVNAAYAAAGLAPYYPRTVSIPRHAWREYQLIDTSSAGDYPGDIGGPGESGRSTTFTFGAPVTDNLQTNAPIHIEGWIYAGKKLKLHRAGTIVGLVMARDKKVKLETSDEDRDEDDDDSYDCDHHSTHTDDRDDDDDHHSHHPSDVSEHRDHACDWHHEAHRRRLSLYFQDNLNIRVIGAGQKQTSWLEIPCPEF